MTTCIILHRHSCVVALTAQAYTHGRKDKDSKTLLARCLLLHLRSVKINTSPTVSIQA